MIREIKQEPIKYEEYWVIRIIHDCGCEKKCVAEYEYPASPSTQDIV